MVLPQLYLIRWLRVLFTREFTLKQSIMLWDALFLHKGLQLVDFLAVAMLSYIRQDLLSLDATLCLMKVFHYPSLDDRQVKELMDLALEMYGKVEGNKKKTNRRQLNVSFDTEKLTKQLEEFKSLSIAKFGEARAYISRLLEEQQRRKRMNRPDLMEEMREWDASWTNKLTEEDEDEFETPVVSRDMTSEWDNVSNIDDLMTAVPWQPDLLAQEEAKKKEAEEKRAVAARAAKKRAAIARARKEKAAAKAKAQRLKDEAAARARRKKEDEEKKQWQQEKASKSLNGGADVYEYDDGEDAGWDDL